MSPPHSSSCSTPVLTADEIVARTARAVAAATAAGKELGLRVDEPRVLYDVFSVIVHLAPTPVVVRVPAVLPPSYSRDPDAQTAQQRSELAVAGWLADRGHPVVPPSPLVPREPVRPGRLFDDVLAVRRAVPRCCAGHAQAASNRPHGCTPHCAITTVASSGSGRPFGTYIPEGLAELEANARPAPILPISNGRNGNGPSSRPYSRRARPLSQRFPALDIQPIHGDAPYHNMIATPDGELWSDFELVTLGAVESDLAMVGPEGVATYDAAAVALGLRPLDARGAASHGGRGPARQ